MQNNMVEYLNIFIQVVEQGSFTKAADVLQIHRPTVSKAIQKIESDVGVKLIHRTTRKLSVTAEGDEFYHRARHVLTEVNDMLATFSPSLPPRGRLRIDVPLALAHTILIPNIKKFQELYPGIEIVIVSSDRKNDLITEGVDCLVRLGELQDSSFIHKRLGDIRMVTCAAPSYLRQHELPEKIADLGKHQTVSFFNDHSREVMEWKFIEDKNIISFRPTSGLLVDNSDVLLSCGLAGLGIIQATFDAVASHISSGALQEVLTQYPSLSKPVSAMYPDRRYLSPKVRVFIDWFSDLLATQLR